MENKNEKPKKKNRMGNHCINFAVTEQERELIDRRMGRRPELQTAVRIC